MNKRYADNIKTVDKLKSYDITEAVSLLKGMNSAKFDETIEVAINLGVDPKHADQLVRGTVSLPNGTGKEVKVIVMSKDEEKIKEAKDSGADYAGFDEYFDKIKNGWFEFDVLVATPDMMSEVGKLGKILGPRGLMPNPKTGTVTKDISKAVSEVKAGKIEFRVEKNGIIHNSIGKVSFSKEKIIENVQVFVNAILKSRPQAAKGTYMKKVTITSTMGPGIKLDQSSILK